MGLLLSSSPLSGSTEEEGESETVSNHTQYIHYIRTTATVEHPEHRTTLCLLSLLDRTECKMQHHSSC